MEETSGASGVGQRAARSAMANAVQAPPPPTAVNAEGVRREVTTVQTVGTRAFYRRGDAWIDANLLNADADEAEEIEQFSDAYFALARQLSTEDVQYLAFEDDALVQLDGQAYWIRAVRE